MRYRYTKLVRHIMMERKKGINLMEQKKAGQLRIGMDFCVLMAALGASDSLRGIFAPAFQEHFSLSAFQLSLIIMTSYAGNLIFLYLGGRVLDRYHRKHAAMGIMAIWIFAVLLYLVTDSYVFLLVGMFLSVGASTLLNTTVNLLTPVIFAAAPGMMINIFFFVQGIGTSLSQSLAGRDAGNYGTFQMMNLLLAGMGILSLVLLWKSKIPDTRDMTKDNKETVLQVSFRTVISQKGYWLLVMMFGFYFIGEHGVLNWLVSYGIQDLGLTSGKASFYLSAFYGGITLGRLLFSPFVSRLGTVATIRWFGGIGTLLFILGIVLGQSGIWILSLSGLAISVLYPTMLFLIRSYYPEHMLATALGAVISAATLFDIGFNLIFGKMIDTLGFTISFLALPICMALFYISYLCLIKRGKDGIQTVNKG